MQAGRFITVSYILLIPWRVYKFKTDLLLQRLKQGTGLFIKRAADIEGNDALGRVQGPHDSQPLIGVYDRAQVGDLVSVNPRKDLQSIPAGIRIFHGTTRWTGSG